MDLPILKADTSEKERTALIASFTTWVDGYLEQVNKQLKSDADFTQAKLDVKQCADLEDRIKTFEAAILERFGVLKLREYQKKLASVRCGLRSDINDETTKRKSLLVQAFSVRAREIAEEMQGRLKYHFDVPPFEAHAAIKGKRTIASCEKALQTALLEYQELTSAYLGDMAQRSKVFENCIIGYEFLFPNPSEIIQGLSLSMIEQLVASRIEAYKLSQQSTSATATPATVATVEDVDTETGEVIEREVEMVSIPSDEYQYLLKCKQVIKSLNHFGLKLWEHYEEAMLHAKQALGG